MIASIPAKVYPYYQSLGAALYGADRPAWDPPKAFTQPLDRAVWKYVLMKEEEPSIGLRMRPYFCRVEVSGRQPEAKLSPLPSSTRQQDASNWTTAARDAFHRVMSQYSLFQCPLDAVAWEAAEKRVRGVVGDDAVLVPDGSTLTVAGRADEMRRVRAAVEAIVVQTTRQRERETTAVTEDVDVSSVMFLILQQDGLHRTAQNLWPDMKVSYSDASHTLQLTGLKAEVQQLKTWILERTMQMKTRPVTTDPCLLHFLGSVDPVATSQDLFTSRGIGAFYAVDSSRLVLSGSSDRSLDDAETELRRAFSVQTLDVEDQEVLRLQTWLDLTRELLGAYNSPETAVAVETERGGTVTVAGFTRPVAEVGRSLKDFISDQSRVQQTLDLGSSAVVQFVNKRKMNEWNNIVKANGVTARFDSDQNNVSISGARVHVQRACSCFLELVGSVHTHTFTVDKPGAKKYFLSQGSVFLSSILAESRCAGGLVEDGHEAAEAQCHCRVRSRGGVLVSVSRADMCSFAVDAVVNAANEDLQHIGGLALALLRAAGPRLQRSSDAYVQRHGRVCPGDAVVTDAGDLPTRYVVHAVGPRFSESDRHTAVRLLQTAVCRSLQQAERVGCASVALPAISAGVFGFPVDLCAQTIAQALSEYCDGATSLSEIHLVDNNADTVRVLAAAVQKQFGHIGPTVPEPKQEGQKRSQASG